MPRRLVVTGPLVAELARAVLAIDEGNEDAAAFLRMAEANQAGPPASPAAPPPPTAPAPAAPALPESFGAERFHVQRFLGEGSKKKVYLAHDALLGRDVAFPPDQDGRRRSLIKTDDVGREQIMREAQAMGRLTHPHIVSIFDIGEQDGSPYIIEELMGGGDVEGLLEDADEPPSLAKALEIGIAVCLGLEYAHEQGVVHRGLKPGNVWLTADGTPKIGDFGLAVDLGRSRLTQHGMMVGTLGYMPPEQALGGEVTPQADLYSLGAMLYELVTGRTPFQGDTPTAVIFPAPQCSPVSPLVQVGRAWGAVHGVGTGATPEVAGELVRLFPALREAIPDLVEPERVETEASQFRLFDAYSQFMRAQSRRRRGSWSWTTCTGRISPRSGSSSTSRAS